LVGNEHPPHNVHIIEFETTHLKVVLWIQWPYETRLARTEIGGQLIKGFGCQHLSFKVQTWAAREQMVQVIISDESMIDLIKRCDLKP
jgi:hypothetical protein